MGVTASTIGWEGGGGGRRLAEDGDECRRGGNEWENGIEEEVGGGGGAATSEGVGGKRVEGSANAVEADGKGECKGAVYGEISDAEDEAYCIEPADTAACQQA